MRDVDSVRPFSDIRAAELEILICAMDGTGRLQRDLAEIRSLGTIFEMDWALV